jgi:hypothetical protein
VLYSGHDTVLAPILGAISAGGAGIPCGWPPYASRLVWEVWLKRNGGGRPRQAAGGQASVAASSVGGSSPPGGSPSGSPLGMQQGSAGSAGAGPAFSNSSGQARAGEDRRDEAYLRVLYNGKTITTHIAGCHGRRQRKGGEAELGRGAGEMCPLRNFERALRRSMDSPACTEAGGVRL